MVGLITRLRAGTDDFYNYTYYGGSIAAQAHREGWNKGLRDEALTRFRSERRANPPDNYRVKAIAEVRALTSRRKRRGKFVSWLAMIAWLMSGFYCLVTDTQSSYIPLRLLAYFVVGAFIAKILIGGCFQILWGAANLCQLGLMAAIEGTISFRWTGFRKPIMSCVFGFGICIAEIILTAALASWVFRHAVIGV
jgi:hypothetical protein